MPGFRVFCLPSMSPAGPAKPLLMPCLTIGNGHSRPLPFPSHPPSSTALPSWKPALLDRIWPRLFILHVGPSQPFPASTHSYLCPVPTASHIAPEVQSGVSGAQAAIHSVPGNSQEFLSVSHLPLGQSRSLCGVCGPSAAGGTWRLEGGEARSPATRAWLA